MEVVIKLANRLPEIIGSRTCVVSATKFIHCSPCENYIVTFNRNLKWNRLDEAQTWVL